VITKKMKIELTGKWVLAGEHTVIRGAPAILVPASEFPFVLEYRENTASEPREWTIQSWGTLSPVVKRAVDLLEEWDGLSLIQVPVFESIQSRIPEGAGLGSSAAICVSVARAVLSLNKPNGFEKELEWRLATRLEDLFHGTSSGMDVAAISLQRPILFQSGAVQGEILLPPSFRFQLEDTGIRSQTKLCVEKVKAAVAKNPEGDEAMRRAVELARLGIEEVDPLKVVASMEFSTAIYRDWGLVTPEIEAKMKATLNRGARSVRLTGSGLGGYLVSFWVD
jgi:mevalonate kinase